MTTASSFSDGVGSEHEPVKQRSNSHSVDVQNLPRRDSAPTSETCHLHGDVPPPSQPHLILFPQASKQIVEHARSDLRSEVGGILLGAAYRHESRVYVDVHAALPVRSSDHGPVHFTFNADAWANLHRERSERYPELNIVGWFHTHPGLGIFFSGDDVVVQSAAFVMPWHVALVVDPVQRTMGLFGRCDGELSALAGFYEVVDAQNGAPLLPWQARKGEIWDETYMERMAATRASEAQQRARLPQLKAWHALAVAAGSLLLSLGMLLLAVFPLSSQNEALRLAVAGLAGRVIEQGAATGAASCPDPSLRLYSPLPDAQLAVGQELTLVGSARYPGARSYRLDVRPSGEQAWWPLGQFRRATSSAAFLTWDTSSFTAGTYEIRLAPAAHSGELLPGAATCTVRIQLLPPQ